MTVTQLIEQLRKVQAREPEAEVYFEMRALDASPQLHRLVFGKASLAHRPDGLACVIDLITDLALPRTRD